jgi:hypothetical protein
VRLPVSRKASATVAVGVGRLLCSLDGKQSRRLDASFGVPNHDVRDVAIHEFRRKESTTTPIRGSSLLSCRVFLTVRERGRSSSPPPPHRSWSFSMLSARARAFLGDGRTFGALRPSQPGGAGSLATASQTLAGSACAVHVGS